MLTHDAGYRYRGHPSTLVSALVDLPYQNPIAAFFTMDQAQPRPQALPGSNCAIFLMANRTLPVVLACTRPVLLGCLAIMPLPPCTAIGYRIAKVPQQFPQK
jgi:hypothetical protein